MKNAIQDTFAVLLGADYPPDRIEEVVAAYRGILDEIRKLRTLDLTDIHPAVVFDPKAGYPEA
jgi:hypothetical protein